MGGPLGDGGDRRWAYDVGSLDRCHDELFRYQQARRTYFYAPVRRMKKPKRPRDPSQLAKMLVDIASGEKEEPAPKVSAAAELGAKGGKARAKALTKTQRSEIARKAAAKRWGTG
jgi:hypothetical protein